MCLLLLIFHQLAAHLFYAFDISCFLSIWKDIKGLMFDAALSFSPNKMSLLETPHSLLMHYNHDYLTRAIKMFNPTQFIDCPALHWSVLPFKGLAFPRIRSFCCRIIVEFVVHTPVNILWAVEIKELFSLGPYVIYNKGSLEDFWALWNKRLWPSLNQNILYLDPPQPNSQYFSWLKECYHNIFCSVWSLFFSSFGLCSLHNCWFARYCTPPLSG